MSSAARAERRRQARAPKRPATCDRVFQQGDGDCHAAAVASVLRLPLAEMPAIDGLTSPTFWESWDEWLAGRGLASMLLSWCPGHLDRWIAVLGRSPGGPFHSVVMAGPALHHDPAPRHQRVHRIERGDVMAAVVIGDLEDQSWSERLSDEGRRGIATGDPRMWRIERLLDCEWHVNVHRMRGEHEKADAMRARLNETETR